jgi:hypothetical protein
MRDRPPDDLLLLVEPVREFSLRRFCEFVDLFASITSVFDFFFRFVMIN